MAREIDRKDLAPFLEEDPPSWVIKGLSYILILLFSTAVLLASLVKIPETVSSPFVLMPVQGTDPIRSLYDGTVVSISANEGEFVKKGKTLFVMRSDSLIDRASEFRSLETRHRGAQESLSNAKKRFESQNYTDKQEIVGLKQRNENLKRRIQLKSEEMALMKEKVDRYKKLYDTGISSHTDYSDQQLEMKKIAIEVEDLGQEVSDNQILISKLENGMATRRVEFEESKHSYDQELERTSNRMDMLKPGLHQSEREELLIPASCNGTVLRLRVTAPGAVVQDGDILGEVVCSETTLQAELSVPSSGVGRIRQGQVVKLLYDSFPFQRYGVKSGSVRWISPAANQSVFRVLVDLNERSVNVGGQKRELLPGMGGLAEVIIGRRSVISFAFEPIRQLRENLK